jgi:hypothetical protein
VVKLVPEYEIFINKTIKARILAMCKTHTQLARHTMEAVFTADILKSCSLQGRPIKAQAGQQTRDPLDPIGLAAVLSMYLFM